MSEIIMNCPLHGDLTVEKIKKQIKRNISKNYCKECFNKKRRDYVNKYRLTNKEIVRKRARLDRIKNPEKYRAYDKKYRYKDIEYSRKKDKLYKFSLSIERYDEIVKMQQNKCLICNKEETRKRRSEGAAPLSIDHCHKCPSHIRGLLCMACNTALGKAKDDINLIQKAMEYLISFE